MSTLTISFEAKGEERFNCASSKMTKFAMVYAVENKIEEIYECLNTASNTITTDGRAILQSLIDTSNTYHNDLYETINTISKDLLDNLGKNPLGTFSRRIFSNEVWEAIIILDDPSINKMTAEEMFPLRKKDFVPTYNENVVYLSNRSPVSLTLEVSHLGGHDQEFKFMGVNSDNLYRVIDQSSLEIGQNNIRELIEYINHINELYVNNGKIEPIRLGVGNGSFGMSATLVLDQMTSEECENMIQRFGHLDFPNRDEETNIPNNPNRSDVVTLRPFIEIEAIESYSCIKSTDIETPYLKIALTDVQSGLLNGNKSIAGSILSDVDHIFIQSEGDHSWILNELSKCPKLVDTNMNDKTNILSSMFDQEDLPKASFDLSTPNFNITLTFKKVKE